MVVNTTSKNAWEKMRCPFNSLYWNFLDDKRSQLATNHRMKMMYSVLNKFSTDELIAMKLRASQVIETPENF